MSLTIISKATCLLHRYSNPNYTGINNHCVLGLFSICCAFPEADGLRDIYFCGILWGQVCHMKKPCARLRSLKWDLDGSVAFFRIFPGLNALCSTVNCIWKSAKHHGRAGECKHFAETQSSLMPHEASHHVTFPRVELFAPNH